MSTRIKVIEAMAGPLLPTRGPCRAGHSSPVITLRIYAHTWPGDQDPTRDVMDTTLDGLRTVCGLTESEMDSVVAKIPKPAPAVLGVQEADRAVARPGRPIRSLGAVRSLGGSRRGRSGSRGSAR